MSGRRAKGRPEPGDPRSGGEISAARGSRADARAVSAAARAVALRGPLSRIQLVAGRLARETQAGVEASLACVEALDEAVAEIDRGIGEVLAMLLPPTTSAREADVAETLERLRDRVRPSLAARGIEWLPVEAPEPPLRGPAHWLHEIAVALVGDAAACVGRGGRLRIDAVPGPFGNLGLRVGFVGTTRGARSGPEAFAASAALALRLGACVARDGNRGATFWLPGEEAQPSPGQDGAGSRGDGEATASRDGEAAPRGHGEAASCGVS